VIAPTAFSTPAGTSTEPIEALTLLRMWSGFQPESNASHRLRRTSAS
jgi:hypothetical protein